MCRKTSCKMWWWLLLLWVEVGVALDFSVFIPEVCVWGEVDSGEAVNVSWIKEMVLLGIREDRPQLSLHITPPTELCDGSFGLLKMLSLAGEGSGGQVVGSLPRHLCDTAAVAFHSRGKHFSTWSCPKMGGVVSIQPPLSDLILAVTRLVKHLSWRKFAFAKLQNDKSSFCDDMGTALREHLESDETTILVLPKYEDVHLPQYSSLLDGVEGLFLCISYYHGLTYHQEQRETKTEVKAKVRLPIVLLPEWPLPLDIVLHYSPPAPSSPLLALLSHPQPYNFKNTPKNVAHELEAKPSWESFAEFVPLEPHNHSKRRILEPLLARLILHSMKVSMEYDLWTKRKKEEESHEDEVHFKPPSFRFLVFKYEKDRWHPLVNLVGNLPHPQSPLGEHRLHRFISDYEKSRQSILLWLQIIGGTVLTIILIGISLWLGTYVREKYRNHLYTIANTNAHANQKKLIPRTRNQGPYKLLLTSRDICFGNTPNPIAISFNNESNNKQMGHIPSQEIVHTATPMSSIDHTRHQQHPYSRTPSSDDGKSTEKPDLIKGSVGLNPMKKALSKANLKNDSFILTENQARYKGDLVHLRRLSEPTSEPFEIKAKAMNVLETIHGLRHENLAALIGVLTDGIPAMVWEYCSRGSLHDIIKQQDIKLDWAFKLSLLTDLVRGMKYLHSSLVRVHGFLTSYNCVIDARWVLKITDYGVLSFYHNQPLPLLPRTNKELLWTAPELLRDESLRKHGTQPGDVYSFAIIMQEILVRGEPYCMLNLSTDEILEKVRHPPPLIRPSVSKGAAPPEAINVMRQCWAEIPDMRPDFVTIHDRFKTLNHGRKANIVDTMFEMLEKYSNNLEELIRERTEQLDLEKKKTEQLLNRMLPSTVAEKLKVGLPVDPEEFPEVTIYFSDIVGFTTISAYSTPFEVVDLLNDLYTCFDATINDYNVYKVETIGDAYMVVGGAPIRSPDHADQIATMALDLLYESGRFRIRHLPFTPLRLRIGIHTGPCCAGVVGLTMPRYCLFGDTVNTTSRMESTGAPWRIHISSSTKAKLDNIGGYVIEYRGVTDIKGKGKMPTYWLLGKEGFHKELPPPPPLSEAHGLDEKSILYGRTGIPPASQENLQLNPKTGFKESRQNSQEGSGSIGPSLIESSKGPAFNLLQGEALRCLSPAEEVAHQLLNGRPAVRGLRRQFSLDQGTNYYVPLIPVSGRVPFRKTPSLEETFGDHSHQSLLSNSNRSLQRNSNSNSSLHQLSFEVPSTTAKLFSFNTNFTPTPAANTTQTPTSPPIDVVVKDKSDNKELSPDTNSISTSTSAKCKVTLSPRTGRIFKKSPSLTIVEETESPTQE